VIALLMAALLGGTIPPGEMMEWPTDAGDVAVSFDLMNRGVGEGAASPEPWDGAHLALRYQGECRSYYVSLNRRDDTLVIKKKAPDGLSDCGSYYNLSGYVPYHVPYDAWQSFRAAVTDGTDGSVTIKVWVDGKLVAVGRDDGAGGPPIREPGEVLLRSDGAELEYAGFRVQAAGAVK
jgi:hypothetical protein